MSAIVVLGTFDTRGEEHAFVADRIRERGHTVLTADVGAVGESTWTADFQPHGRATVLIPSRGISAISAPGQPFHDPDADHALYASLRQQLRPDVRVVEVDAPINAPEFADRCVGELLANMRGGAETL